jgi:hypothetical protein
MGQCHSPSGRIPRSSAAGIHRQGQPANTRPKNSEFPQGRGGSSFSLNDRHQNSGICGPEDGVLDRCLIILLFSILVGTHSSASIRAIKLCTSYGSPAHGRIPQYLALSTYILE